MKKIEDWIKDMEFQINALRNPDHLTISNLKFMGWKQEHLDFAANHIENFVRAMKKDIEENIKLEKLLEEKLKELHILAKRDGPESDSVKSFYKENSNIGDFENLASILIWGMNK